MEKEVQHSPGKQRQIMESLKSRLYPYQVEGLEFFQNAFTKGRKGVILADEMGLGKSIQVISFLSSLGSLAKKIPSILLVVPTNLLDDWEGKVHDWAPWIMCLKYHQSEQLQDRNLSKVKRKGGILITTYGVIIGHKKDLSFWHSSPYAWDFMVFDEAHRLKNERTKTYKVASSIQANFRILLTGTPIQNNLKELWNLLSLISETCLLGTYQTFRKNFENPITRGREADARADERALAQEMMEYLKKTIQPVWLRRTKDQLPKLPNKHEFVLWIKLTAEQEAEYHHQLSVDEATNGPSTLKLLHNLRKICCLCNSSESQIADSGKLAVLIGLLKKQSSEGHKILVFFQYVETLKIVRDILVQTDWGQRTVLFMDGTVALSQRTRLLKSFQNGSQRILLLTVKVGAEGLNLTVADRVIIMEPSWNQCADAQAVDRVHRIGQRREVEVYRFITCGTIEEKIYRRQLFKGSLARQAVGDDQNPLRHFTRSELMELKMLGETQYSATQLQLEHQNFKYLSAEKILGKLLEEQVSGSLCGISDHSQLLKASQGEDLEAEMEKLYIADEVQRSKEEIEGEAHLKCNKPFVDAPDYKKQRKTLGVCLKGTKNDTILNIYQNKPKKYISRKSFINAARHSTQFSGKTPGLPRKFKQFSSPFRASVQKKRRLICPPQYLDLELSYDVDTQEKTDEMGNSNSSKDSHYADDLPPDTTFTDDSVCESVIKPVYSIQYSGKTPGLPQFSSPLPVSVQKNRCITSPLQYVDSNENDRFADNSQHTQVHPADSDEVDNSGSLTECPIKYSTKSVGIGSTPLNANDLYLSSVKTVSATGASLLSAVKSQDQKLDLTVLQTSSLTPPSSSFNDSSEVSSTNSTPPDFNEDSVLSTDSNLLINKKTQHPRHLKSVTQTPKSASFPVHLHDTADSQPSGQLVLSSPSKRRIRKSYLPCSSPVALLCDYSLSPGSVSVTSSPHVEKSSQVSSECPDSDPEVPQTEKSESHSSNSFKDPLQSDDKLLEHDTGDESVLESSSTAHNNVSDDLTESSTQSKLILSLSDQSKSEDLEAEIKRNTIAVEVLRSEEESGGGGEKVEASFNSKGVIKDDHSHNSVEVSPEETCSINTRTTDINIIRTITLDRSGPSPKMVPISDASLLSESEVQHAEQELCVAQSPMSASTPVKHHDDHEAPLSPSQLESLCQSRKLPSSFSSLVPFLCDYSLTPGTMSLTNNSHMEKSSQVSGECHDSDSEVPQMEKRERHSSNSFRDPQQSDDKLLEHYTGDESAFQSSVTTHNNTPASLKDLITQFKLILNSSDQNQSEDLEAEIQTIQIADEVLRSEEETGEKVETSFNPKGDIKDDHSHNGVEVSPEETCSINTRTSDINIISTITLDASGLHFSSPKMVPISDASLLSESELQHAEQELCVAQCSMSASTPVKNHDNHEDPLSPTQLESLHQSQKLPSSFSSLVSLLYDYSLTPGSMSLARTPQMEKSSQVSGDCPDSDPEVPQTEKSEGHSSNSFRDPLQSDDKLLEHYTEDEIVLQSSVTAHNNASADLKDLSTQFKLILNSSDQDKSEDLEAEIKSIQIADEVLRSEAETGENVEASFNSKGVIKDDHSHNGVQVSPDKTCSIGPRTADVNVISTKTLDASGLHLLSPKMVPISNASLHSASELQHPEQELCVAQSPTSASTPVKNRDHGDPLSPTQLESLHQSRKLPSSFSSLVPLLCDYSLTPGSLSLPNNSHMEKSSQVSGECPDSDSEVPQTEKSKRHNSNSFRDPLQSDCKVLEHYTGDENLLESSITAHNNASANLKDLSTQFKLILNSSDRNKTEDLEEEIKRIQINEVLRSEEETGEKVEASLNFKGVIKDDLSHNSVQVSPDKTCSISPKTADVNVIRTIALDASGLRLLSPKMVPISDANLLSASELQHPEQKLCVALVPKIGSTPVKNKSDHADPLSPTQLESLCQSQKLPSSFSSPVVLLCDYSVTCGSVAMARTPQMEKSSQVSCECPDGDPEVPQTEKSERHSSNSFRDPLQSGDKPSEHDTGDENVFQSSVTAHNNTSANLKDLSTQFKLILNSSDQDKSEDLEAEIKSIQIADEVLRSEEETGEKVEASLNSKGVIKDDHSHNSVQVSPDKTCSISPRTTDVNVIRTIALDASGLHLLSPKIVPISDASLLSASELQHPEQELCVALVPKIASTQVKNKSDHADPLSPTPLESLCQSQELSSSFSSPVALLCDYSVTCGSVVMARTPQMEKSSQVSGECPDSDPEVPQTEKSERHSSNSFRDPLQSDDKPSEHEAEEDSVLESPSAAHKYAFANLTNSGTNCKLILTKDDLESEIKTIHIADKVRGEEEIEKVEASLNTQGAIKYDSCNSDQVSPKETCSINHSLADVTTSDLEDLQTEKREKHISNSFRDPCQSDDRLSEYYVSNILDISRKTQNTATTNLTDLCLAHKVIFNYSDEGRIEDPEVERKGSHIGDEVPKSKDDIEKSEVHLNCQRVITNDDSDNISQSSPEETYSTYYRMTYANVMRRVTLNVSGHFLSSQAVPITQTNLLSENELRHPGQNLSIVQTARLTSTPVRNHDCLVDPQSPTQLERPCQILKLSLSPIPPPIEKTPQVSGVCHASDHEELKTDKNERHSSTSFRDSHQSDLESSSAAHNNAGALTDLSFQHSLTLSPNDTVIDEDLETKFEKCHIAESYLSYNMFHSISQDCDNGSNKADHEPLTDHKSDDTELESLEEKSTLHHSVTDTDNGTMSLNTSGPHTSGPEPLAVTDSYKEEQSSSDSSPLSLGSKGSIADVADVHEVSRLDSAREDHSDESVPASTEETSPKKDSVIQISNQMFPLDTTALPCSSPMTVSGTHVSSPLDVEIQDPRQTVRDRKCIVS